MLEIPQIGNLRKENRQRTEDTKQLFLNLEKTLGNNQEKAIELLYKIDEMIESFGGKHEKDFDTYIHRVAGEYPSLNASGKTLLVRREDPERLFTALEKEEPLQVDFRSDTHGGDPYPNAGVLGWDASGLRIPYQRGFGKIGQGKIVFVVGFTPNFEHIKVAPLPKGESLSDEAYVHYQDPKEREQVRMIEGEVYPEELRFIIARFPKKYFPEEELTDEELENENVLHVSRVYSFNQKEKGHRQ